MKQIIPLSVSLGVVVIGWMQTQEWAKLQNDSLISTNTHNKRTNFQYVIYLFIQYIARNWPWYSLHGLHIRITWFSLYGIRIPLFSLYGIHMPLFP